MNYQKVMAFLILPLAMFFDSSFAKDKGRYVKVLYKDGRVEVVDTEKVPLSVLKENKDIIYIEEPIKLKPLNTHSNGGKSDK